MNNEPNLIAGGDLEADGYRASVSGEEAVGGSASVPGQNDPEDMAIAVGISLPDGTPLNVQDMMEDRDEDRWELDPASAQDWSAKATEVDPETEVLIDIEKNNTVMQLNGFGICPDLSVKNQILLHRSPSYY
ncbi:MAG: hypothetical protein HC778_00385 [Chamaesiphon sp. CSU_1_12]|nr:hypothetical protein [Chamaesiphon sp. CSU_1_12]